MCYLSRSEPTSIFGTNDVLCRVIWRHLTAPAKQFLIFDDVGGWQPRVNAEKIGFAQSKFSSCPNTAARKKERKPIVQTNSKVMLHIIANLWVVSVDLSTLRNKFNFFHTQLEAIQEHLSSYCTFQKDTNSEVKKPPSQLRFSLPLIIITITSNEPWNTEKHQTDRNLPITNHDLFNPLR